MEYLYYVYIRDDAVNVEIKRHVALKGLVIEISQVGFYAESSMNK